MTKIRKILEFLAKIGSLEMFKILWNALNEIRHEIHSHKEFLANERRIFKERVDKIDSCFNTKDKTEDEYKVY